MSKPKRPKIRLNRRRPSLGISMPRHIGLTLLELLAVIAIVGLLIAIVLPAVQLIRESARRLQCSNNLRQLGLGLQNYSAAYGVFPAALQASLDIGGGPGSNKFYSVHTRLLPFLEQTDLYNSINFGLTFNPAPLDVPRVPKQNRTAAVAVVEMFLCPSDTQMMPFKANASYRVNLGTGAYKFADDSSSAGAFTLFVWHTGRDFTDGTSHTVGMSEKLLGDGNDGRFSSSRDFWYTGAALTGILPPTDSIERICAALTAPLPDHYSQAGCTWMMGAYETTFYNHTVTPNAATPDCSVEQPGIPPHTNGGVFAARSNHSGGVNCLMMDGAVRFVGTGIDVMVWRKVGTRAGGETLGAVEF